MTKQRMLWIVILSIAFWFGWVVASYLFPIKPDVEVATTVPGSVAPVPSIEEHTKAVMENEITYAGNATNLTIIFSPPFKKGDLYRVTGRGTLELFNVESMNLTWNTLKDLGVEVICAEMVDKNGQITKPVNPYPATAYMPCSKVERVILDKHIEVERR